MTTPVLNVSTEPLLSIAADVLVIGVKKTDAGPVIVSDEPSILALQDSLSLIGFSGAQDELRRLPFTGAAAGSIALVGLGTGTIAAVQLRYAAGTAARQLTGVESIALALPAADDAELTAILEGASIGAYAYVAYRSASLAGTKLPASTITVASSLPAEKAIARANATATAMVTVRDLVNAPPSDLYPETLAQATVDLAEGTGVSVEVLREDELEAGGFGGILGVGRGSSRGPRLVKVTYSPAEAERHIALVGKGITFDSGGLSLKPAGSMIGMKYDMTGAATVMAVTLAAAELGLKVKITAWMCIAENLPSGTAARPNDVMRIRGGKTVEVLNTDAEGRLVLADGIVAASEEAPDAIIDVATLTGAQVVALGNRYTAVMGDDDLVAQVVATAGRVGETMWPMPLPAYLRPMLNSDVADIANIKAGNSASGMLLAGVFLKDFVGTVGEEGAERTIPWAHLDIAGPSENAGGGYGYLPKGPTGVTVRTLLALAEEISLA
jgi:leucyl aminopeptidase